MYLWKSGHLTWRWDGVVVPKPKLGSSTKVDVSPSPYFSLWDREWCLECYACSGCVKLELKPRDLSLPPPAPFSVTVEVLKNREMSDWAIRQKIFTGRLPVKDHVIWCTPVWCVEYLYRLTFCRSLTFRVAFKAQDPLRGKGSADVQRFGTVWPRYSTVTTKTANASVQTSLTGDSISSLDAFSADIAKLQDSGSDLNVELRCDGHSARAHKDILSVRSPVLDRMLRSDMFERRTGIVDIQDMKAQTFRTFLEFLFTGKLEDSSAMTFDSVLSLYKVGDMYEVGSLKTLCSNLLVANLTTNNALDALVVAEAHRDPEFLDKVTEFLLKEKVPAFDEQRWQGFCKNHPAAANVVLNRHYKRTGGVVKGKEY